MQQDNTKEKTIVLQTFAGIMEAKTIQNELLANGITSFLNDENVLGMDPIGGVELKIFEKDKDAAWQIIKKLPGNP